MPPCPSDETLRRLARESLASAEFAEVDAHIASCAGCKQRLGRLVRECRSTESEIPEFVPAKDKPPPIPGFEVEYEIGRGAMGVVYLARDQRLGRRVALKVMPGGHGEDGRARKRWRTEALAFSRVRHPNVVALYEIGEADAWLFLVLEYIPGGPLKQRLSGPVSQEAAAGLMVKIALAVETIHLAGLLHLDLKPSNILVDAEDNVPLDRVTPRVADFGIARLSPMGAAIAGDTGTTLMGPWGGTASYMAPEQISGRRSELGPAADIHALGAVLYELLTGRPPFQGVTVLHTLEMVRDTEPVSPRKINPRVSRDLETITLKCLRKDAKRRYESARALADDLTRCLENRPILARPVSRPERAWRWCRRRPALATTLAALAATLAALVATVVIGFVALDTLYLQAVTERDRAELALEREVKSRKLTSAALDRLEQLCECDNSSAAKMENTTNLLREHILDARATPGLVVNHVIHFWHVSMLRANLALQSRRLDDARQVTKGCIDFLEDYRAHNSGNEAILWGTVHTCLLAATIEHSAVSAREALGFLDRASAVFKNARTDDPGRLDYIVRLSGEYRHLEDRLASEGMTELARRAADGRMKLVALFDDADPATAWQTLSRACLLADDGDWNQARDLVATLLERPAFVERVPENCRAGTLSVLSQ